MWNSPGRYPLVLSLGAALAAASGIIAATASRTSAAAPSPLVAGPPWVSIEYPVNPFDRSTRGAHLLVHAFHHGTPVQYPVTGTAEGVVAGERRTITLRFEATSRPGVYALRKQWPSEGAWTLVINVTQSEADASGVAQALVELSPGGSVAAVQVPTRRSGEFDFPRRLSAEEIERAVRANAQRVAVAGRTRS